MLQINKIGALRGVPARMGYGENRRVEPRGKAFPLLMNFKEKRQKSFPFIPFIQVLPLKAYYHYYGLRQIFEFYNIYLKLGSQRERASKKRLTRFARAEFFLCRNPAYANFYFSFLKLQNLHIFI